MKYVFSNNLIFSYLEVALQLNTSSAKEMMSNSVNLIQQSWLAIGCFSEWNHCSQQYNSLRNLSALQNSFHLNVRVSMNCSVITTSKYLFFHGVFRKWGFVEVGNIEISLIYLFILATLYCVWLCSAFWMLTSSLFWSFSESISLQLMAIDPLAMSGVFGSFSSQLKTICRQVFPCRSWLQFLGPSFCWNYNQFCV